MAIKIYEQFAPFANPADGDYPYGSIKNDSIPGAEDGTPLDADWGNDYAGFDAALLGEAGIVPSGQPDKLGASQRMEALLNVFSESSGSRSFKSFGVTGLGFSLEDEALQAAIDWAGSAQGRRVHGRSGDIYRISSDLVLKWDGKFLDSSSTAILDFTGTKIVADADNITALKISRNYAQVYNPTVENPNNRANVVAYALTPEDEAQTTTKVSQMFCRVFNPVARDCAVAFKLKPGPTVAGENSGAFYHDIYSPDFYNCTRGFYFQRSVSGDNLSTRVNIFSPKHVYGNCAFDIEAADSLIVWGGSAEFIENSGPHAGNPTLKIHKPVPADALSTSNIRFVNFTGEAGTTPFDFSQTVEQVSMPGCTFFGYTNEGINSTYSLQNMWQNEGAVVSRAEYSSQTTPMLAARRDVGSNIGQAYLQYKNQVSYPAEFYADRGFTFASPIGIARIANLQNTDSNSQIIGSSLGRLAISGDGTTGTVLFYNTSGLAGRAIEFGGVFSFGPNGDNSVSCGTASKRVSVYYGATGSINTSDEREKTEILTVDDALLDAWGEVNHVTFKWIESVASKGDEARTHFGVIAQQIRDAFEAKGIDGTKYGLLCYDQWDDQWEPILEKRTFDVEKERWDEGENKLVKYTVQEVREVDTGEKKLVMEAGERWGIRADQCAFIEAAYQRRRCDRMEARLTALESR